MIIYHYGHPKGRKRATKGKSCNGKDKFYSREAARRAMFQMKNRKKDISWLEVYPCKFCTRELKKNGHT